MIERKVKKQVQGFRTQDGAGVSLVRVLGNNTIEEYSPILMLDSFDSVNPEDYIAGFPMHPHRGIETISYVYRGKMIHKDSLGNQDMIADGEVQWMTAGSGILHEEQLPASDRMLGVQLWLNLPAKNKMVTPAYHSIKNADIEEIPLEHGKIRLLAGTYKDSQGYLSKYLPLDYYDIHLDEECSVDIETKPNYSVILFTLLGDVYVGNQKVREKTAVKLTDGDFVRLKSTNQKSQILFISSTVLDEPVAWGGPIVMNSQAELRHAFAELSQGTFIKEGMSYENK